ncbi:ALP1-like protein isoform X1 [Tanacetum coccineum]
MTRNIVSLKGDKKVHEMMSNVLLVFSKDVGGIIQQPTRQYHVNRIRRIMYSCIIIHNMILEDQKMAFSDWNEMHANLSRNMQRTWIERCDVQRQKAKEIRDKEVHLRLQRNLMEHIWQQREDEDE